MMSGRSRSRAAHVTHVTPHIRAELCRDPTFVRRFLLEAESFTCPAPRSTSRATVHIPDEVEEWLARYRRALEGKDLTAMRELGEIRTDADVDEWRARFAAVRDYEVRLENVEVERHADRARVAFDRSERWKDPRNPGFVLDFAPEVKTLVREGCRVIAAR